MATKKKSDSIISTLGVPFLSILLGFILGAVIMLIFGYNPIQAYSVMFQGVFASPYFLGEAILQASILTFTGLAFSIASKGGFFNIGIAGQFLAGWLAAVAFGLAFPDIPRVIMVPLILLVGIVVGALYAGIAGVLRAYFGTSEVIVTIMLNHTMVQISNYLTNFVIGSGNRTEAVGPNASLRLDFLTDLTGGSRLNMGIFIAIIVVILYKIFMDQTTMGFEIKSVGLNPDAAQYAGMSAKKNIILSMLISGGLAGLGGVISGIGTFGNMFVQSGLPTEGFNGIAVGLLGMGNPIGIFLSALLFGVLEVGSKFMPTQAGIPDELSEVVIAAIIFFIGANYIIRLVLNKFTAKDVAKEGGQ